MHIQHMDRVPKINTCTKMYIMYMYMYISTISGHKIELIEQLYCRY